jgi:hypothetical protein
MPVISSVRYSYSEWSSGQTSAAARKVDPVVAATKRNSGAAGQGLSGVSQICGCHRHPQQGLRADPKGVAGEVQVEKEDP